MRINLFFSLVLVGLVACKDEVDPDCGDAECPVGTAYDVYHKDREGINVTVSGSHTSATSVSKGQVAYKNYGEGECRYTCVAISECPEDTWPVITEDCFTCALLDDDGEPVSVDCGD